VLWDKRQNETDSQYANFLWYLGLGADRSLERACSERRGDIREWKAWSTTFQWTERAKAYDRVNTEANAYHDAVLLHQLHAKFLSGQYYRVAQLTLQKLTKYIEKLEPDDITIGVFPSLIRAVVDLGRVALESEAHVLAIDKIVEDLIVDAE
jgi:hypothetical protein